METVYLGQNKNGISYATCSRLVSACGPSMQCMQGGAQLLPRAPTHTLPLQQCSDPSMLLCCLDPVMLP